MWAMLEFLFPSSHPQGAFTLRVLFSPALPLESYFYILFFVALVISL